MRGAGTALLALAMAGCANPSAPTRPLTILPAAVVFDEPVWSAWTEPVGGISCRAVLQPRVVRGDRILAILDLRIQPDPMGPGMTHFDARDIKDQVALLLRNRSDGRTVSLETDDEDIIREGPPPPDERAAPDWLKIADSPTGEWRFEFPLAQAWEALEPGDWEAQVELKGRTYGDTSECAFIEIRTPPLPVVIDPAPARHLPFRPPVGLLLKPGESPKWVDVCFNPGPSKVIDLAPRHGFVIQMVVQRPSGDTSMSSHWTSGRWELEDDQAIDTLLPSDKGPLDRTYEIDIYEAPLDPGFPNFPEKTIGYRSLWKGTLRVTATAAEIEALRR